jgi:hypothetical protein
MTGADGFFRQAAQTYTEANRRTLQWMLARRKSPAAFLNTKQNSITLADYGEDDGWRGPGFTYGWIQGRGLEALCTHAAFFEEREPAFARDIDAAAKPLYQALDELRRRDGHAYFCYDRGLQPIYPGTDETVLPQARPADLFTYSDAFVCKGLVAASARYEPEALPRQVEALAAVIAAIEDGRFVMDERSRLGQAALEAQRDDFGPRMILLGAAGLLKRLGRSDEAGYADRFIRHVLTRHFDEPSGLLRSVRGRDECNVGHGIEFVGFAVEALGADIDPALLMKLERVLIASFNAGFCGPGICLTVSVETGLPISRYCPWWSLPETIRAAALMFERTGNGEILAVWRDAHDAFFRKYWRGEPPIAYQTMTADGPVDYVPATPDLDPGYHTGLSLLQAIGAAERVGKVHRQGTTKRTFESVSLSPKSDAHCGTAIPSLAV